MRFETLPLIDFNLLYFIVKSRVVCNPAVLRADLYAEASFHIKGRQIAHRNINI